MEKIDKKSLLNMVIGAAIDAGTAIMDVYTSNDFCVKVKEDESPLTKADLRSHEVIENYLLSSGIPVLSEEGKSIKFSEREKWSRLWLIDPLDGTKEFIKRNGEFTVNIALVENNVPVLGVVYAPVLKHLYFGLKDVGAFKVDLHSYESDIALEMLMKAGEKLPVNKNQEELVVVASKSHFSKETGCFVDGLKSVFGKVDFTSVGSSLKICMVAEGMADVYPRLGHTMEWDTAAGQAIVLASGGSVLKFSDKLALEYNREDLLNPWFVVFKNGFDISRVEHLMSK